MSSAVLVLAFAFSSLVLSSGENIHCPDAKYEENCVLRLETPKVRRLPQNASYWPIYPSHGLNYSNNGLTNLILDSRNTAGNMVETNSSDTISVGDGNTKPYINLNGIPMLIVSNNSLTVNELMTILHDQSFEDTNNTHILKYLDLSYLNISWLPENVFEFFPRLRILKLNNNPIRNMENVKFAIKQLKWLEELDISGCGLQHLSFDLFRGLRLRVLNLSNNLFTNVPNLNYLSYSLFKLIIDNNPIRFLDDTSFRTLYFIEEISAENCNIQGITGETFSTNDNLRKLNLKNNSLHYLLPSDIPWRSTWINLENNPWDCSCRNLWLMRETHHVHTNFIHPRNIRCRTPAVYKHWPLFDVLKMIEGNNGCKEFFNEFVDLFSGKPTLPSLSQSTLSLELQRVCVYEKTTMNLFIIAILITAIAVLWRRKSGHSSRSYLVYNILQHKEKLNLDDKNNTNTVQHM